MLYLSIPQHRRDRATHEKARSLRPGELRWTRWYTDDLDELAGEPLSVRFLDEALVKLASKRGWRIPNDPRRIAGRLELRPSDVSKAISRLLTLQRLDLIDVPDELSTATDVQIGLDLHGSDPSTDPPSDLPSDPPSDLPTQRQVTSAVNAESAHSVSAQVQASLESVAPSELTHLPQKRGTEQEQEQEQEKAFTSNGTVASYDARATGVANAQDREIVNRLIGLTCRGNHKSADVVRYECVGLPDSAIARTIESYLGRIPRPSGAGYAVNTLRALRTELGLTDTRPRVQREPKLT